MRVFVTGATGFIGSAVVRELLDAGHQVVGLARSDTAGVIHLAYIHDFANIAASAPIDQRAVDAVGAALAGTGKPFVGTSGVLVGSPGHLVREQDAPVPGSFGQHRIASENAVIAMAERGVRSSVVRLSPSVHGQGDYGFVPMLIGLSRDKGISAMVGDGANRWPAVHRLDAARLFRLAVEAAPAGTRLHGVGEEGVPLHDIAGVIGRQLKVPVVSMSREEADAHFGWLFGAASVDSPASSAATRELLDWRPVHPTLIADLEEGHYFNEF